MWLLILEPETSLNAAYLGSSRSDGWTSVSSRKVFAEQTVVVHRAADEFRYFQFSSSSFSVHRETNQAIAVGSLVKPDHKALLRPAPPLLPCSSLSSPSTTEASGGAILQANTRPGNSNMRRPRRSSFGSGDASGTPGIFDQKRRTELLAEARRKRVAWVEEARGVDEGVDGARKRKEDEAAENGRKAESELERVRSTFVIGLSDYVWLDLHVSMNQSAISVMLCMFQQ